MKMVLLFIKKIKNKGIKIEEGRGECNKNLPCIVHPTSFRGKNALRCFSISILILLVEELCVLVENYFIHVQSLCLKKKRENQQDKKEKTIGCLH
jgi:hypothetical protein